jgi:hypothetical protein
LILKLSNPFVEKNMLSANINYNWYYIIYVITVFCWAYMCTNLSTTAEQILEAVSDRMAIEQNFAALKEIEGAG